MTVRRAFLRRAGQLGIAATAGLALRPAPALAGEGRQTFEIMRRGAKIGTHTLRYIHSGDGLTVRIAIDIAVKLGPVTAYSFSHRNREVWQEKALASFNSETDDNGKREQVMAAHGADGIVAVGKDGRHTYPADAYATTYWSRRFLERPTWINTQTGAPARCEVKALGSESIEAVGQTMSADKFAVTGDLELELWYVEEHWMGLAFKGPDGAEIRYHAVEANGLDEATLT